MANKKTAGGYVDNCGGLKSSVPLPKPPAKQTPKKGTSKKK